MAESCSAVGSELPNPTISPRLPAVCGWVSHPKPTELAVSPLSRGQRGLRKSSPKPAISAPGPLPLLLREGPASLLLLPYLAPGWVSRSGPDGPILSSHALREGVPEAVPCPHPQCAPAVLSFCSFLASFRDLPLVLTCHWFHHLLQTCLPQNPGPRSPRA